MFYFFLFLFPAKMNRAFLTANIVCSNNEFIHSISFPYTRFIVLISLYTHIQTHFDNMNEKKIDRNNTKLNWGRLNIMHSIFDSTTSDHDELHKFMRPDGQRTPVVNIPDCNVEYYYHIHTFVLVIQSSSSW